MGNSEPSSNPTQSFDEKVHNILIDFAAVTSVEMSKRPSEVKMRPLVKEAMRKVHQAVVELIEKAKPEEMETDGAFEKYPNGYNKAIDQFEHNLIEGLGGKK